MFKQAHRGLILVAAISAGVWSAIQVHEVAARNFIEPVSRPIRRVEVKPSPSVSEQNPAESRGPAGYRYTGMTLIGNDCFARYVSDYVSETPGSGNGVTEAFGADGRLNERFAAVEDGSGWKIVEFLRMPSEMALCQEAQK